MNNIIKTFALDVPKGCEVVSTIENGTTILLKKGKDLSTIKIPYGEWKILTIQDEVIHLLPKSKEVAISEGWIN